MAFRNAILMAVLSLGILLGNVEKAHANILDFTVVGVQLNLDGSRTVYADLLDLGSYGCNWHRLYLTIDGVPYPVNGWNIIATNGVVARAWFVVPQYFGVHTLQLHAVFPVTVPSPYYPYYYWTTVDQWSLARIYPF